MVSKPSLSMVPDRLATPGIQGPGHLYFQELMSGDDTIKAMLLTALLMPSTRKSRDTQVAEAQLAHKAMYSKNP